VEARLDDLRGSFPGGAGRHEWANLPESFLDARGGESGDRSRGPGQRTRGVWVAGAGTASCARRTQGLAAALSALCRGDGRGRIALGRGGGERVGRCISRRSKSRIGCADTSKRGHARGCSPQRHWPSARTSRHFAIRIGLPDARTLHIESPFDYREQARIYLPRNMPEPQHPEFAHKFIAACAPFARSKRWTRVPSLYEFIAAWQRGVAALKARFPQPPFPSARPGAGAARRRCSVSFRELGNAVLLATGSFWEGVDVKGEALSIVAIDKLPLAAPDDPLLKARLEGIRRRGGNPVLRISIAAGGPVIEAGGGPLDSRLR